MATILTCATNLLEASTVSLTTGAAAAGYPLYRICDRDPGRMFVGSAATTTVIRVDQGTAGVAVDTFIVPSGHNLAGVTCELAHSPDAASWTDALGGTFVAAAGNIVKTFASIARRYWRFTITSPGAAPQIAEMFLSPTVTWTRNPSRPGGNQDDIMNVTVAVTAAGRPKFEVNGQSLRQRNYTLSRIGSTQRTQVEALWATWAGSKPIWLCDHEGVWIYARMTAPLALREVAANVYDATFNVIEVPA